MNRITISLIFLIMISIFLPASAILYASGQTTDNSGSSTSGSSTSGSSTTDNSGSSTSGSTDNSGSSTTDNSGSSTSGSTDNSGSSTSGGTTTTTTDSSGSSTSGGTTTTTTDSSGSSTSGSTGNSATLPTTSTASNNTGNTQGVDINSILDLHNQERAAVGVPPLTWSNTLAASAQKWADQLLATGKLEHSTCCGAFKDYGENLAYAGPGYATQAGLAQFWANEKKDYVPCNPCNYSGTGHYTQMVWKDSTEVGCGFASGPGGAYAKYGGTDILVCQYTPPGNSNNQPPY